MTRILLTSYLLALIACGGGKNSSNLNDSENDGDLNTKEQPLFPNSEVSNNLDFIREFDQGPEGVLNYDGIFRQEMPDKRNNILHADNVYTFRAVFGDGSSVGIWVHPDVGDIEQATVIATKIINPVGMLHKVMRSKLDHIVIHNGDETAFAEKNAHFFVLYSNNIATRIANNDLEETVFHEAVHATLDKQHAESEAWKTAVTKDNAYITDYAAKNPIKEDLAESALFAWAIIIHPGRLPASIEERVKALIPHRIAFFKEIFY